ncbi:MAG: hypothetical protein NZM43_09040 [Saprospiraceae bacterium]|nr:hypothetical protein [Saprospiraceae bacterium]MDW8484458.1 hypothetical protein [Saprospiraceae bacterium]
MVTSTLQGAFRNSLKKEESRFLLEKLLESAIDYPDKTRHKIENYTF